MKQFNIMTRRLFFVKGSFFCSQKKMLFFLGRFIDHEEGKGKPHVQHGYIGPLLIGDFEHTSSSRAEVPTPLHHPIENRN